MAFLDVEAAMVARLEAQLAAGGRSDARVLTSADAANMEERSQIAPALYVVFDGYAPTQQVGEGVVQEIEQDWTVYVTIRNARSHANAQGVRDSAAPLIQIALQALCGWKPGADFRGLKMAAGSGPVFSDAGFGYFPLRFKTRTVIRGAQ